MNKHLAIDGNQQLLEAIEAADAGQTIVLTKAGEPVARISVEKTRDRRAAAAALDNTFAREFRLDGLSLLELRDEGRRG